MADLKSIEEGGGRTASVESMAGRTGRRTKAGKTSMDEAGKAVKRQEKPGKERNTVESRDWQSSRGKQGKEVGTVGKRHRKGRESKGGGKKG